MSEKVKQFLHAKKLILEMLQFYLFICSLKFDLGTINIDPARIHA